LPEASRLKVNVEKESSNKNCLVLTFIINQDLKVVWLNLMDYKLTANDDNYQLLLHDLPDIKISVDLLLNNPCSENKLLVPPGIIY